MLLSNNSEKVKNLVKSVYALTGIEKLRLAIYLFEHLEFTIDYDIESFIILLKEVLEQLDPEYNKTITCFGVYKTLVLILALNMELNETDKKKFSIELLFSIYEHDFEDNEINEKINKRLNVYDYAYSLDIM